MIFKISLDRLFKEIADHSEKYDRLEEKIDKMVGEERMTFLISG